MSDVVIRLGEVEEVPVNVGEDIYIKGDKGNTFFPNVSENGDLSWSNDGGLPNPSTVNIKGPEGEPGNYTKPASGIPKSDLASAVQASLDKADTALQEHQSLAAYRTSAAQDLIDAGKLGTSGNGSNVTAAFTAAGTRTNIATGEKLSVIFGKIAKWFTDLGTAAFRAATSSISSGSTSLIESGAVYTALGAKYEKPSGGIPKADLANAIQTSLGKADTALQSVPNTYRTATAQDVIDARQDANVGIVQNGNTATQNISAGQYVIWRGALYIASSAITSGTTLSASNLTAVSGGGLNALNILIAASVPSKSITMPSTTASFTLNIPNTGRFLMCASDSSLNRTALFHVISFASGTVFAKEIGTSNFTFDTTTVNRLKVTMSSSGKVALSVWAISGNKESLNSVYFVT